eukprot:TRINITY_DN14971_c0_g3_i1.p1 TRINITY_DN14971_c0_g3~~TRINITY_DN14971_c0_g3_i1.p1  ORF type:complete len:369 (+),score=174.57 TRINITY_DN14971_c0_g3_i1:63-1169(+)
MRRAVCAARLLAAAAPRYATSVAAKAEAPNDVSVPVCPEMVRGAVELMDMEDLQKNRQYVKKKMLVSQVLTFRHAGKGTTVEVVPLYHLNVDKWYVAGVIKRLTDLSRASTVYLGSPLVTVKETMDEATQRGYSAPLACELSLTSDFPKAIPVPFLAKAPQYVQLHSREQYVELCLKRGVGGLEVLTQKLNEDEDAALHVQDSVCILTPPVGAEYLLKQLTEEKGWTVAAERITVAESLFRKYGLFLNGFVRFTKLAVALFCLANLHLVFAYFDNIQKAVETDGKAKEISLEDVKLYNSWYRPEQDAVLKKLQAACLAAPPGSGTADTRVHESFYSRPMKWENVAYPKPMKDRGLPIDAVQPEAYPDK